jgi:hypothetical protein
MLLSEIIFLRGKKEKKEKMEDRINSNVLDIKS